MQRVHGVATVRSKSESVNTLFIKPTSNTNNNDNSNETRANINMLFMIVDILLYCGETNTYIRILTFCFGFFFHTIVIYDDSHCESASKFWHSNTDLSATLHFGCMWLLMGLLFSTAFFFSFLSLSFRATFADGGTGWVLVASHTAAAAAASQELSNIAQRLQSPDSGRACLIHQTNNSED